MNNPELLLRKAQEAFRQQDASEALALLDDLLSSGKSSFDAAGHLLRGLIFEFGGNGVSADLARAIENYRQASSLIHNADEIPFLYLARALMKKGPESYRVALSYIQEASTHGHTPNVDLAYAYFYETAPIADLPAAKRHYLRAALSGRFAGFFGYASVLRKTNNKFLASVVDLVRVLLGPFLFFLLGSKARQSFNGY